MFFSYPYLFLTNALALLGKVLTGGVLPLLTLSIYVFTALALQTMAARRGVRCPWLAWIPVANLWLVGCLSDQYRYLTQGKACRKRVWLPVLKIVNGVSLALLVGCVFWMVATGSGASVWALLFFLLLTAAGGLTKTALYFMALYDIYASCDPQNAALYLVLSVFFRFLKPVFLFLCRDQELGMPPRKAVPRQEQEPSATQQEAPPVEEI